MKEQELASLVRSSVKDCIGRERKLGLLFSGGVDSATLAVIARKFTDVTLYVAGTPDSHDMKAGVEVGHILDLPVVPIMISGKKVVTSLEELVQVHGLDDPRWATTFITFNIVAGNIEERLMMSGQGADELFGGYRKYTRCPADQVEKMMHEDLNELLELEAPLYRRIAGSLGKSLTIPFLQPGIVEYAQALPINANFDGERNKAVLRSAARSLGLPGVVAERPKKAMQYGSGVSKLLRSHLKELGTTLPEFMSALDADKSGKRI